VKALLTFTTRRLLFGLPAIWLLITLVFMMVHLAPGDPMMFIAGEADISNEQLARLRQEYGLDQPLATQYLLYMKKVVQGDLGYSSRYRSPVLKLIGDRIPATLLLMGTALVLFIGLGLLLGIMAARRPNSGGDLFLSGLAIFGWSVPVFWLGQLLIIGFALKLDWFPAQGMLNLRAPSQGIERALDMLRYLTLPVMALGMRFLALSTRMTRSSMLQVLRLDYITTARAKGLPERVVLWRHALPNALLPVITIVGMNVGTMLSGSVLTEVVFAWPGMGRLLYDGIFARDYPLIIGIILVVSVAVVLANLVTDVLYSVVDPRIRYN
jgi:ABC-type dipeptide/oligopeptide/nickel transport system permease component